MLSKGEDMAILVSSRSAPALPKSDGSRPSRRDVARQIAALLVKPGSLPDHHHGIAET